MVTNFHVRKSSKETRGCHSLFEARDAGIIRGQVLFLESCKFIIYSISKPSFLLDVIVQILRLFYFHLSWWVQTDSHQNR